MCTALSPRERFKVGVVHQGKRPWRKRKHVVAGVVQHLARRLPRTSRWTVPRTGRGHRTGQLRRFEGVWTATNANTPSSCEHTALASPPAANMGDHLAVALRGARKALGQDAGVVDLLLQTTHLSDREGLVGGRVESIDGEAVKVKGCFQGQRGGSVRTAVANSVGLLRELIWGVENQATIPHMVCLARQKKSTWNTMIYLKYLRNCAPTRQFWPFHLLLRRTSLAFLLLSSHVVSIIGLQGVKE